MTRARRLSWALGGSLVAHLSLLWGLLPSRGVDPPAPARMSSPTPTRVQLYGHPGPKAVSSSEVVPARRGREHLVADPSEAHDDADPPGRPAQPEPVEYMSTERTTGSVPALDRLGLSGMAAPLGANGPPHALGVGAPATAGGGTGAPAMASPADFTALHQALAVAARACYPAAAQRFRLSGEVELAFCAEPGGRTSGVSLRGSTGSQVLDRAAEECVLDRAMPLPVTAGCFHVPVRFGMP